MALRISVLWGLPILFLPTFWLSISSDECFVFCIPKNSLHSQVSTWIMNHVPCWKIFTSIECPLEGVDVLSPGFGFCRFWLFLVAKSSWGQYRSTTCTWQVVPILTLSCLLYTVFKSSSSFLPSSTSKSSIPHDKDWNHQGWIVKNMPSKA